MSIQSVERAIDILHVIAEKRAPAGLPELSKALNLPKTTIHTIVKTLKNKGFLQQDPETKKYSLGLGLFELGSIQMNEQPIQRLAGPLLNQLANSTGLEARLGVWDNNAVVIVIVAHPVGQNRLTRAVGPRIPGYSTALGKAILANLSKEELTRYFKDVDLLKYTQETITDTVALREELQETKQRGFSVSTGELVAYRFALGAPVFGAQETVAGAISISLEHSYSETEEMKDLTSQLLKTSYELSVELGFPMIRTIM